MFLCSGFQPLIIKYSTGMIIITDTLSKTHILGSEFIVLLDFSLSLEFSAKQGPETTAEFVTTGSSNSRSLRSRVLLNNIKRRLRDVAMLVTAILQPAISIMYGFLRLHSHH